ncbi:hypothetical protein Droror1_Dr00003280 [Drosera rotundifolia]
MNDEEISLGGKNLSFLPQCSQILYVIQYQETFRSARVAIVESMACSKSPRSTSQLAALSVVFLLAIQFSFTTVHGDGGDAPNLHAKGLILVKVYCLIIFFVSTFGFGISPYFLRWNESFLLLGTQFAGGVFLGTSLMHFLSDSTSTFQSLTTLGYPFSYMLACAGYLLTMLGDVVIGYVAEKSARDEGKTRPGGHGSDLDEEAQTDVMVDQNPLFLKTTSIGDTVLLILALCFHSVFEGIAVGIAPTEAEAWKNLWIISLHKVFAAMSMGIALLKMLPKNPFLLTAIYSFAFAISSPVGVGIGIAIDATTQGARANWVYAISMGLACGVFVYVAINHLIAKGFKPHSPSYYDTPSFKFLAVFLGIAIIAIVMYWDTG